MFFCLLGYEDENVVKSVLSIHKCSSLQLNIKWQDKIIQTQCEIIYLQTTFHKLHPLYVAVVQSLTHVWLCATLSAVARRAPLSKGFSRQEYWSWVAIAFSMKSSRTRDWIHISCTGKWIFFQLSHLGSSLYMREWLQRLTKHMSCSPKVGRTDKRQYLTWSLLFYDELRLVVQSVIQNKELQEIIKSQPQKNNGAKSKGLGNNWARKETSIILFKGF